MKNILSVDLESWIHFYKEAVKAKQFGETSSERKILDNNYIPDATTNILELLEKHKRKVTFFICGELYEWYPELIEKIEKKGHEIGYHTHNHVILTSAKILEKELEQSSDFIKRFHPVGFRAPVIFITRDSMACLKRWGFKYSSSTYDEYKINKIEGIDEIPVSAISFRGKMETESSQELPKPLTVKMLFRKIPFGSGLFIAIFGSKTSYFINHLNKKNIPAILFIHPWQLYMPERFKGFSFKLKALCNPFAIPYTINILKSVEKLLQHHEFVPFRDYYGEY